MPFLELAGGYRELQGEIDAAIAGVLARGNYILGEEVDAFEREFARAVGVAHCVGVGNGLQAMELVLRAWDIGPGDEVIVPSNAYIATVLAVMHTGAAVRFVEPDPATHNLGSRGLREAITPRTRAIIPVHLYGLPADMDAIRALARPHGIRVLEDAAQAHGAQYRGRTAGSLGHAGAFSFYPTKNLGALGDGGAVTTDDAALAERLRLLRNYGARSRYQSEVIGTNSRLDELQAAVLRVKLRHLDAWNDRRRAQAQAYGQLLSGCACVLPAEPAGSRSCWHLFVVRVEARDAVQRALREAGIGTAVHYPAPPYRQPAMKALGIAPGAFPVADRLAASVLSLPLNPQLASAQLARCASTLREVLARLDAPALAT